jgi:hypothetical protein
MVARQFSCWLSALGTNSIAERFVRLKFASIGKVKPELRWRCTFQSAEIVLVYSADRSITRKNEVLQSVHGGDFPPWCKNGSAFPALTCHSYFSLKVTWSNVPP